MLILIRGAGDLASGIALRLWRAGLRVVMTDLPQPTAIRRTVCFSQAIRLGETAVEDVTAVRCETEAEVRTALSAGKIPVLPDPEGACRLWLRPDALVDAILAKRNLGTRISDAPVVIGVGPGFCAGRDCHAAIETMRGHTLGRVIRSGSGYGDLSSAPRDRRSGRGGRMRRHGERKADVLHDLGRAARHPAGRDAGDGGDEIR